VGSGTSSLRDPTAIEPGTEPVHAREIASWMQAEAKSCPMCAQMHRRARLKHFSDIENFSASAPGLLACYRSELLPSTGRGRAQRSWPNMRLMYAIAGLMPPRHSVPEPPDFSQIKAISVASPRSDCFVHVSNASPFKSTLRSPTCFENHSTCLVRLGSRTFST